MQYSLVATYRFLVEWIWMSKANPYGERQHEHGLVFYFMFMFMRLPSLSLHKRTRQCGHGIFCRWRVSREFK
jgi:hypothetical protein